MKKTIRLSESDLHKIVNETVKRIINEVEFGGESLHGDNPTDWATMRRLRGIRAIDKSLDGLDHTKDDIAGERDFENAFGFSEPRTPKAAISAYEKAYDKDPDAFTGSDNKAKRIMANFGRKPRTVFGISYDGMQESRMRNIVRESVNKVLAEMSWQ